MYSTQTKESFHVQIMLGLLQIEVKNLACETSYIMKTTNEKTIRKGRFTAPSAQLNVTHLPLGHYSLELTQLEEQRIYHVEKKDNDEYLLWM